MTIEEELRALADKYAKALKDKIDARVEEMESDDHSHYLVYQVLGVTDEEGRLIDIYQNKGRFLYKYAGSFLEEATKVCFLRTFPDSGSLKIPNTEGVRPKTFEIDCLEGSNAIEIKWRDATTDGDHITKEHTRINEREIKGTGSYLHYLAFQKHHSLRGEFSAVSNGKTSDSFSKRHPLRGEMTQEGLRPELSWTHYRLLLRVENENAREWYMNEAADQNWSTRQLDRQIASQYYERLLASRNTDPVKQEATEKLSKVEPDQFIRDPYVLEFLNLKDYPDLRETTLEQAIIDKLQHFLLELGKGFSFVARQKRMRFEDEDFYLDLVFYNYILKCFVLIDLKIGKLTHQDIGQMDSYVRMFEDHGKVEGDNPTIGLILCSEKNEAIARYSVLNESQQLFASKYVLYLPTEEELKREVEKERDRIEKEY